MNNVSDLGREDGFWKSKESHTSKWSEGSRRNCESNLTTATGGERSVSSADTRSSIVGMRPTWQDPWDYRL